MIRLRTTLCTEILPAIVTSNPILCHMLCSLQRDRLSFIVLLAHLDFAGDHFHHISTLATNQIRVVLYKVHELPFIDFLLVFLGNKLLAFKICNLLVTSRAAYRFWFGHILNNIFTETVNVNLMKTISGLQHVQILIQLIVLADELVAKHA